MLDDRDLALFKGHKIKAKEIFYIDVIDKQSAYNFVARHHYLGDAQFMCVVAFGLFYRKNDELVGCATYQLPQGTETMSGWFGLDTTTKNIFELGRLCVLPQLNHTNATSYLLGNSIKRISQVNKDSRLRNKRLGMEFGPNDWYCRAVITLATSDRHVGSIYQVCNFEYYGLSNPKKDFFREDGAVNPRGTTSSMLGVWLPRPRKHRYAYILDKTLKCKYATMPRPKQDEVMVRECCHGTKEVYDERFGRYYTCPFCTHKLVRIHTEIEDNDERKREMGVQEQVGLF